MRFEANWRWSCRGLFVRTEGESGYRAHRGRGVARVDSAENADGGENGCGIPDRSGPRWCKDKHCVPCWNRSSTVISILELWLPPGSSAIGDQQKRNCFNFAATSVTGSGYGTCPKMLRHAGRPDLICASSGVRWTDGSVLGLLEQVP